MSKQKRNYRSFLTKIFFQPNAWCVCIAKISFDGNIEILRREMYMWSAWILVRDWLQNEYTENYQPEPKHRKRMLLTVVMDITARTCSSIMLWVLDSWMKWIALKIHCARRIVCCFGAFVFQCLLLKKIYVWYKVLVHK